MKDASKGIFALGLGAVLPAAGVSASWLLKTRFVALIALSVLAVAACRQSPAAAATSAPSELKELHDLEQFKALFNNDHGAPRLALLLSPT
jgi:hypothetical protein